MEKISAEIRGYRSSRTVSVAGAEVECTDRDLVARPRMPWYWPHEPAATEGVAGVMSKRCEGAWPATANRSGSPHETGEIRASASPA